MGNDNLSTSQNVSQFQKMSNVTATSKAAYCHTDLNTQREQVAAFLLQRTFDMRLTSDREISEATGIPLSQIPARRSELMRFKYEAHDKMWMPALMPNRYSRATGRTCQTWAMVVFTGEDILTMKQKTIDFITKLKMK